MRAPTDSANAGMHQDKSEAAVGTWQSLERASHCLPAVITNSLWSNSWREEITIPASRTQGFDVVISKGATGVRVCFGGLEQDFDTVRDAAVWVDRALTGDYQLCVVFCGKRPFRWTLERRWTPDSAPRLAFGYPLLAASFRKTSTVVRYNSG